MSATATQRVGVIDRAECGPAQICALSRELLEIGAVDFCTYRSPEQLLLAARDERGRFLGLPAAWDAYVPAMFLEHVLRDLTTKILAALPEALDPDKLDPEFRELGGLKLLDVESSYSDPLAGTKYGS